jgi:hypothetical protein
MPIIRLWFSHDGYRDADDNLALLLGAAQARVTAKAVSDVRVAGAVFGDTKDGGQYYMLNPEGTAPAAFGTDERYGDVAGNQRGAANHAFFRQYGLEAMADLGKGWKNFDLLATDDGGLRPWTFDATQKEQISAAAGALADDIVSAITLTGGAADPAKIVVYSAGGGANVAAEAIGYLLGRGYAQADLVKHFAVVQHGNNWVTNYEDEARELTRDFTIAITNQNYDVYADGQHGPGLNRAIPAGTTVDGSVFGPAYAEALAVAVGQEAFETLPAGAIFRATRDASDAGSHAFAVDLDRLLPALGDRLGSGEMRTGYELAHLIEEPSGGFRSRILYDSFDPAAVARLLSLGYASAGAFTPPPPEQPAPPAEQPAPPAGTGTLSVAIAATRDDRETRGGAASDDLDFGRVSTAAGPQPNPTGLRFTGLELAAGAEITDAYLLFEAKRGASGASALTVEIEDSLAAASYRSVGAIAARDYLAADVDWIPGAWKAGATYRTPDLSGLIEAVLGGGGLAAEDALAFRIAGTGRRAAQSFDGDGDAPRLVIDYDYG